MIIIILSVTVVIIEEHGVVEAEQVEVVGVAQPLALYV
jgi:hypothetical protein